MLVASDITPIREGEGANVASGRGTTRASTTRKLFAKAPFGAPSRSSVTSAATGTGLLSQTNASSISATAR